MKEYPLLFKKGDYVVLLSTCTGEDIWDDSMPINYVYKLRENCYKNSFHVEKDIQRNLSNGWSCSTLSSNLNKLKFRLATAEEIYIYNLNDKPFPISDLINYKKPDNTYLISLFKKYKIK